MIHIASMTVVVLRGGLMMCDESSATAHGCSNILICKSTPVHRTCTSQPRPILLRSAACIPGAVCCTDILTAEGHPVWISLQAMNCHRCLIPRTCELVPVLLAQCFTKARAQCTGISRAAGVNDESPGVMSGLACGW